MLKTPVFNSNVIHKNNSNHNHNNNKNCNGDSLLYIVGRPKVGDGHGDGRERGRTH